MATRLQRQWKTLPRDRDQSRRLSAALGVTDLTAQILLNRGLRTPEEGRTFLWPALTDLHDPLLFNGMDKAADRILRALAERQKILVYGDYDVDGVTATALLIRFFQEMHAEVDYYIPDRIDEGYGMNSDALSGFKQKGVDLVISVDNGITAIEEMVEARRLGMDVIITDHHEPSSTLPDALAVITAKRADSTYPFRDLAGVGVAFKLAWAVAQAQSGGGKVSPEMRSFLLDSLGLVALGTVADVVPLTGENRVFVHFGLRALAGSRIQGLKAMLAVCDLMGKVPSTTDLAFKLGPRVNAAGRLGDSSAGVKLLTSNSYPEALEIAKFLDAENRRRQGIEQKILVEALDCLERDGGDRESVIVLAREEWHVGVLGIVASKIADIFHKPAVLISIGEDRCKGSARSIPEFHIQQAFAECGSHLVSYGGHAQAAGLVIEKSALEGFRTALLSYASAVMPGAAAPTLAIDAEVGLRDLDGGFVAEIDSLGPFGSANPEPLLASTGLAVAGEARRLGRDGKHLGFHVRSDGAALRAVAFGSGNLAEEVTGAKVDLAYVPKLNTWKGRTEIELVVKDMKIIR